MSAINKRILEAALREFGLPAPEYEYRFHSERRWRFDLAWPGSKVALEVEGGVFGRGKPCPACGRRKAGAHKSVTGLLRDIEKYNEAQLGGWTVLRTVPDKLMKAATFEMVRKAISTEAPV